MLGKPGEQDDRRRATAVECGAQELNAISATEAVIDQDDIMLVADHRLQAVVKILGPIQLKTLAGDLGQEVLGDQEIVFIILHQQYANWRSGAHRAAFLGPANSTMPNQY